MMLLLAAALIVAVPPQGTLRVFHLGMSQDAARRVAGCRLKQPPGRYSAHRLACKSYEFGGAKLQLGLSFTNGTLTEVSLYRGGYSEKRTRRDLDSVLRALRAEYGPLNSPELAGAPIDAEAVIDYLELKRSYAPTASLTVRTASPPPGVDVTAHVSSNRSAVVADGFWSGYASEGSAPPVGGSPFDLVRHSISITLRPSGNAR